MRASLYAPVRNQPFQTMQSQPDWQDSAIEQLVSLSGKVICECGSQKYPVAIEWLDRDDAPSSFERQATSSQYLRFTITYDAEVVWSDFRATFAKAPEITEAYGRRHVSQEYPIGYLHNLVDWVLFAAFIAWPGAIEVTTRGIREVDSELESLGDDSEFEVGFDVDDALKRSWPKIEPIEIEKVWRWLQHLPGFDDRLSSGSVSRAVAALSQIVLGGEWASTELIWAMLGLEALYGEENDSIGTQLRRKSELLLGPPGIDLKALNDAYRFRSKFVHGKVEVPFREKRAGYESHYPFHRSTANAGGFATALLLASVQELIRRDWSRLDYDYRLVDGGSLTDISLGQ